MTRRTKIFLTLGGIILVAGGWVYHIKHRQAPPPVVQTMPVSRMPLVSSVTATGQLEPQSKVDVMADVTGRIVRIAVREGDRVTKGQLLLQIDPAQPQANLDRSQASLASARASASQAKANYDLAKQQFERTTALKKENPTLVSEDEVDKLAAQVTVNKAQWESSDHAVDQALASVREAESELAKTTIVAPMAGEITRLNVNEGETAITGAFSKEAATLLTISDMSVLQTKVKVDESDVWRVSVGDSTEVRLGAFPDSSFVGHVVQISHSAIQSSTGGASGGSGAAGTPTVNYEVTIRLGDVPKQTRPDFSASAKIITAVRPQALAIPIVALTIRDNFGAPGRMGGDQPQHVKMSGGGSGSAMAAPPPTPMAAGGGRDVEGVFVVGADHRVTFRPVRVGITGDMFFEVTDGLKEGEHIVSGPFEVVRQLQTGTLVNDGKL